MIYCRNQENLQKIQNIVEEWIREYSIPAINRPFYRSTFGVDTPFVRDGEKLSFSEFCSTSAHEYAKKFNEWHMKQYGKELSNREYNILALGQTCMLASDDSKMISVKTKR